jgi:hypothetical protein
MGKSDDIVLEKALKKKDIIQNCLLNTIKSYTENTCGVCDNLIEYDCDTLSFQSVDEIVLPFANKEVGREVMVIGTAGTMTGLYGGANGIYIFDLAMKYTDGVNGVKWINMKVSIDDYSQ